jgi:hypothetical protein
MRALSFNQHYTDRPGALQLLRTQQRARRSAQLFEVVERFSGFLVVVFGQDFEWAVTKVFPVAGPHEGGDETQQNANHDYCVITELWQP